jgi:hypothetical protein
MPIAQCINFPANHYDAKQQQHRTTALSKKGESQAGGQGRQPTALNDTAGFEN